MMKMNNSSPTLKSAPPFFNKRSKFARLKSVYALQKTTLIHLMHNAMTPISAVSGYLDLLQDGLHSENDQVSLYNYSKKIEKGIEEVGLILQQLQEMVDDGEAGYESDDDCIVEANYLVDSVISGLIKSPFINREAITLNESNSPLYVKVDLSMLKLIVSNMVKISLKLSSRDKVEITLSNRKNEFVLEVEAGAVRMTGSEFKHLIEMFDDNSHLKSTKEAGLPANSISVLTIDMSKQCLEQMDGRMLMDWNEKDHLNFQICLPAEELFI